MTHVSSSRKRCLIGSKEKLEGGAAVIKVGLFGKLNTKVIGIEQIIQEICEK